MLVNEFGEIGIDAALLGGGVDEVAIREVPGGCMCCAAGLPMQVALNQLLAKARPERLLIEPTGLGHPKEIVRILHQPEYRQVLDPRAVVTLIDARKVADSRYIGHEIFRQQLEVADLIVASKQDLYGDGDLARLERFLDELGLGAIPLHAVSDGALDPAWLDVPHRREVAASAAHSTPAALLADACDTGTPLPAVGYLRKVQQRDGYRSAGWRFAADRHFDHDRLYLLLSGIDAERIKAVARTDRGVVGFNMADGVLTTLPLDQADDSRIEVIARQALDWDAMERALLEAWQSNGGAAE